MIMSKREKIMLIVLAVVIVLSGGYTAYAYRDKIFSKKTVAPIAVTSNTNTNLADNSNLNGNANTNKSTITPIVDAGVSWIAPQKLADLGLFTQKEGGDCDFTAMEYYKTADLSSGGSIILSRTSCGMGGSYYFLFRKDIDEKYYYLSKHSANDVLSNTPDGYLASFGSKTFVDGSTIYASILPPVALTVDNGLQLKKSANALFGLTGFFSEINNATKVGETNYGPVYKVIEDKDNPIVNRSLIVKLADTTVVDYNQDIPFVLDDGVPNVTIDGVKNTSKYIKSLVEACGYRNNLSILKSSVDLDGRLVSIGTTTQGDPIYYPKNASDAIMNAAYIFYKTGREDSAISATEFFAKKPIFFWKDSFGDYITFLKDDYAPLAECGKPVIYLYPSTLTKVSVSVGANITKSDPAYINGWTVMADPSGKLTLGGKTYDSLFWEGQGNGVYPEVNSGFVVAKENIKATLIDHLTRLGLNKKERNDFLAFWLPKMPSTPFVRLTWFGTREMDALAPLKVTPKPDTSIRIFLDYEGLQKATLLKPQKLSAPVRKGFTLVEWGGLLRGNLK